MTPDRTLPFAGTDEELEQYLQEFAGRSGAWALKDPRRGGWQLLSGAFLSFNPNTVPLKLRISRSSSGLLLKSQRRTLPWTRAKLDRIAGHRLGQLADYLTARVRGSGPEKFNGLPLREPYAPFGSGVAALTSSFTWTVLTTLAALAAAFGIMTVVSIPLMSLSIGNILEHSTALLKAGAIPLPNPDEVKSMGPVGPALVFAFPIAFFVGLVHSAALAFGDLGPRAARLPQASGLFIAILVTVAFFPYFWFRALLFGLVVPAGIHLGSTLIWARRRERLREGPRPAKALVIIAVALAASLGGAAMPRPAEWKESLLRIALFRDAFLLGNSPGKAVANAYYRNTLYTAEPLKEFYSTDPARARKAQPIALVTDRTLEPLLRALHFTLATEPPVDVAVGGRVSAGIASRDLPAHPDLGTLKTALDEVSRSSFRGERLRELCALGWHAVYYAGPVAMLLLAMGALSPLVSIAFRKLKPQMAVFALSACAIVTSLSLVLLAERKPAFEDADLAAALVDPSAGIRHEAAWRAAQLESTAPLADALLKASDDADVCVRLWAVAALGRSGDPRSFHRLAKALEDPELYVRYRAAEGLGSFKDPRAVPLLVGMMRRRTWYEGAYALDALRRIQPGVH